MNDVEYRKLTKMVEPEKFTIGSLNWDVSALRNIKDENNKEIIVDYINREREKAADNSLDKLVKYIEKHYLKLTNLPSGKEFFAILQEKIKSERRGMDEEKKKYVELKKKESSIEGYDKIHDHSREMFWCQHRIDEHSRTINLIESVIAQLHSTIEYRQRVKKEEEKSVT